jgi:hypothetical protein
MSSSCRPATLETKADGTAVSLYGPWMPRGGDRALVTLEVVEGTLASMLADLTLVVFLENSEDTGDGTQAGSTFITLSAAGRDAEEFGPLKELVRYKVTIAAAGSNDLRWRCSGC